jgi:flagellar L-ring protein precursor FlgH
MKWDRGTVRYRAVRRVMAALAALAAIPAIPAISVIRAIRAVATVMLVTALSSTALVSTASAADDARSMFDEDHYRSLVAETKAAQVGDVLTVIVQEQASAASSTDLHAQRSFSLSAHADSFTSKPARVASAGTSTASDGTGSTERTGRLLTQISVRVTEVKENGDLVVSGQQRLQINTLTGIVRPRDIGENNTVASNRIADANIEFDGKGFVTRQSRPGWVAWLLSFLGL